MKYNVVINYYDVGDDLMWVEMFKVDVSKKGVDVKSIRKAVYPSSIADKLLENNNERDQLNKLLDKTLKPILNRIRLKKCPRCGLKLRKVEKDFESYLSETGAYLSDIYDDLSKRDYRREEYFKCSRCQISLKVWEKVVDGGANYSLEYILRRDNLEARYSLTESYKNDRVFLLADLRFLDGLIKMGLVNLEQYVKSKCR